MSPKNKERNEKRPKNSIEFLPFYFWRLIMTWISQDSEDPGHDYERWYACFWGWYIMKWNLMKIILIWWKCLKSPEIALFTPVDHHLWRRFSWEWAAFEDLPSPSFFRRAILSFHFPTQPLHPLWAVWFCMNGCMNVRNDSVWMNLLLLFYNPKSQNIPKKFQRNKNAACHKNKNEW